MLVAGSELAKARAMVDVPMGRGHVVLFANNPMRRQKTRGSFVLLLNAALHFGHLHVARKLSGKGAAGPVKKADDNAESGAPLASHNHPLVCCLVLPFGITVTYSS